MRDEVNDNDELSEKAEEDACLVGSLKRNNSACVVKLVKNYDAYGEELVELSGQAFQIDEVFDEDDKKVEELEAKLLKETRKSLKLIEMIVALKKHSKELKVAHEKLKKEVECMNVVYKAIKMLGVCRIGILIIRTKTSLIGWPTWC